MIIENGVGNANKAFVDKNNQLHGASITRERFQDATIKGNSYNINTGLIGLTTATESAILYFLNDEDSVNGSSSFIVDAIAVGIDDEGTTTGMTTITIIRNPTTGTIIDTTPVAVDMNQNRNFGSNNTLSTTSLAYKGAEGDTLTNGDDIALFLQQPGTRAYYNLDFEITKGSSIGIKMDTDTSGGTTNVYCALIGHRVDGNNDRA